MTHSAGATGLLLSGQRRGPPRGWPPHPAAVGGTGRRRAAERGRQPGWTARPQQPSPEQRL